MAILRRPRIFSRFGDWYIDWWHLPELGINIGTSPKAGTQSVKLMIKDYTRLYVMCFEHPSIWVVREPIARFKSLWRQKVRDGGNMANKSQKLVEDLTPDELLDMIETSEYRDAHWMRQSELMGPHATQIIPIEKLGDWWEKQGYGKGEHVHKTSGHVEVSPELEARLKKYYADDVEMYEKAVRDYES